MSEPAELKRIKRNEPQPEIGDKKPDSSSPSHIHDQKEKIESADVPYSSSQQNLKMNLYLENSPLGMIETGTDHKILQWTGRSEKIFGWKKEEVIGKNIRELKIIYEEDVEHVSESIKKLSAEKTGIVSNRNYTRDGRVIECIWYNSVLLDENGEMSSILSQVDDVTEQKQAERELRESEEKYRILFESMWEGFGLLEIVRDKKGMPVDFRIINANPSMTKHTGLRLEDNAGKLFSKLVPKNEKYWFDILIKAAMSDKPQVYENCSPFRKKHFRINAFCYRPGIVAVIVEDITRRKLAEKELVKAGKKLEIALNTGHIGTWEWNLRTDTMEWDTRMERMFGLNKKSGKTYKLFENSIKEDDIPNFRKAVKQAIKSDLPVETAFRSKLDESQYIILKGVVIRNRNNIPSGIVGVCFDVSRMQKGADNFMLRLNEELLRSNRELEQFAYVASHDLQEPLRMISSFTQLLAQRYSDKLDDDAREYIRFAVDGSKRMYDLINGLLAYSRVQIKGEEFSRVDMNRVISKVLHNLRLSILETGTEINTENLPEITADEGQMIQLLQNLISNAIKFSREKPVINVSAIKRKDYFVFCIKDEGIGIEPQYFDKIFKIYQQLEPDHYKGTGIGLPICKRIVERHGGRIWVESEPGKGSEFYFLLPENADLFPLQNG